MCEKIQIFLPFQLTILAEFLSALNTAFYSVSSAWILLAWIYSVSWDIPICFMGCEERIHFEKIQTWLKPKSLAVFQKVLDLCMNSKIIQRIEKIQRTFLWYLSPQVLRYEPLSNCWRRRNFPIGSICHSSLWHQAETSASSHCWAEIHT